MLNVSFSMEHGRSVTTRAQSEEARHVTLMRTLSLSYRPVLNVCVPNSRLGAGLRMMTESYELQ